MQSKQRDASHGRHFVRKTVVNGEIALVYIPTAEQQADGLTKALPLQTHQTLCRLNKFLVQYVFPEHFYLFVYMLDVCIVLL